MKQHHITIKDIARTLGISPSTVSRALKDHPDISAETKQQVQQLAQSVNYRPNALALGLRKAKTNTIGIIVPEIVHHFFSTVISGIDDAAFAAGYSTIVCQTNEDEGRERKQIQTLLDSRVDGLLISISKTTTHIDHLQELVDNDTPVVFFDRVCDNIESHRVITDDFEGARIATHHLINMGCRRIAHLTGAPSLQISKGRLDGYKTALQEAGIAIDENIIIECDSPERIPEVEDKITTIAAEIDGIFAINDDTAISVMRLLMHNGYRVPDDIQVIGFGDGPYSSMVEPPLTTVRQQGYDMGRIAMEMLTAQIERGTIEIDFETRVLTPTLVVRASTKPKSTD